MCLETNPMTQVLEYNISLTRSLASIFEKIQKNMSNFNFKMNLQRTEGTLSQSVTHQIAKEI